MPVGLFGLLGSFIPTDRQHEYHYLAGGKRGKAKRRAANRRARKARRA